ncbi:MAG: hypothetical protein Kow0077_08920 [Anaerolineae bacterium]
MNAKTKHERRYRSLFWPIVLISAGIIALLANTGILRCEHYAVLLRLWPIALIAIGLDLLFGRSSPLVGSLIGIGAVALIIGLMFVGPSLGFTAAQDYQQAVINIPLDGAERATIALNLALGRTTVAALPEDSDALVEGEITYLGELEQTITGDTEKRFELGVTGTDGGLNWGPFTSFLGCSGDQELRWDLRVSPALPITMAVNGGVGDATLDLSGLQLDALTVDGGVGSTAITLPAGSYTARVLGGVGDVTVRIEDGADTRLEINGGVGTVTVDVPDDAGVRVESSSGVGNVNLPAGFQSLSSADDEETWENTAYGQAETRILIIHDGGVGDLNIR